MRRLRVYIAGPIDGSGKHIPNLRRALEAADKLQRAGFAPYVPQLDLIWQLVMGTIPQVQETDDAYLCICDALYRLEGTSPGADHEVSVAIELGIPTFFEHGSMRCFERLLDWGAARLQELDAEGL